MTSIPLHKIRVVLFENIHPGGVELLRAQGYTVEALPKSLEGDALIEACAEAHIVGIRSKTHLTEEVFANAERLMSVGCFCIGTDQVDLRAAASRGVAVFNAPFSNTRSVAEKTIAEVIALSRRLFERSSAMHAGRWVKSASGSHEVRGRTLGIVGYGRIGSQVSVLAESLGMRVLYYDASDCLPLGNAQAAGSLGELLERSDCVTLHVPDLPSTAMLIGMKELRAMKKGASLINNARGAVVDVEALRECLLDGHLSGAAVDVFPSEPATNDAEFESPLRGIPSVILTPHVAGSTQEAQANIAQEVGGKLVRHMNNASTTTAVNVPNVDLPTLHAGHHRLVHFHRNEPGVLGKIHGVIAAENINIAASYLQSDAAHGYTILDIARCAPEREKALIEGLKAIPGTISTRAIW